MQDSSLSFDGAYINTQQTTPSPRPKKSNLLWIIVGVMALVTLGLIGFIVMGSSFSLSGEDEPTPSPSASISPSPTPQEVDKSELKVAILNGTGIAGEASLLKTKLEELGYEDITTSNASTKSDTTTVSFSSDFPSELKEEVLEMLSDTYSTVEEDSEALEDFDIQIVTGLRPGVTRPTATPKSSASPTPKSSASPTASASATP